MKTHREVNGDGGQDALAQTSVRAARLRARMASIAPQPVFAGKATAAEHTLGVPVLGRIPFDARIARCCDRGTPFVIAHPEAPAARVLMEIAVQIATRPVRGDGH